MPDEAVPVSEESVVPSYAEYRSRRIEVLRTFLRLAEGA